MSDVVTWQKILRKYNEDMPNRILRDWTDSFIVDELDVHAERFFVRLIMKVDDFGRFSADKRLLKSQLFPLKSDIRDTDIARCLTACEKAGLITIYTVASKCYLQIENFKQTLRQKTTKYPSPDECIADATHMISRCESIASLKRNETETRNETEEEGEGEKKAPTPDFTKMENLFPGYREDTASEQVITGSEKKEKSSAKKEKSNPPDLESFLNAAKEIYQNELKVDFSPYSFAVAAKYNSWIDAGWKDGHKKPIEGWKNKLRNVIPYLKPFNHNSQNGSSQARRR
ncbi:hypothetical protein [Chryseobacterium indologenes]|uniref:hypothetical protein n=1 Tax=Chryseobacterium indologenes TaxID=253 RepID=UPI001623B9D7|nr:hypothetical protein [Chryseobacterium indologenes]